MKKQIDDKCMAGNLRIGTCSWNYPSWVGLVYSEPRRTSVEYLHEYVRMYDTGEIDSWFYKIPSPSEVAAYGEAARDGFLFTVKAPQKITQATEYGKSEKNPLFLSVEEYSGFFKRIEPIKNSIACVMFEFEYLNRQKMSGPAEFFGRLKAFLSGIPRDIPVAIECRNKNYLIDDYYDLLRECGAAPVLAEKQFLPPVTELIDTYGLRFNGPVVIRLLGNDRKEIEAKTGQVWNTVVDPKPLAAIGRGVVRLAGAGLRVIINVNNHFEGSAPKTIERLKCAIDAAQRDLPTSAGR
jgi:uncharacterized protein YecE (DUF72 family)